VVDNSTVSINAARVYAWIATFVTNATLFAGAIGVQDALGPTSAVWITNVI